MPKFFSILLLGLRKIQYHMLEVCKIIFLAFSLAACTSSQPIPYELTATEYEALKAFFSVIVFEEGGAYTLFSNKPLTFDPLVSLSEIQPEEKELCITTEDWQNGWQKIKNRVRTPLFLLVERPSPLTEDRAVFLVNIGATAITLNRNYTVFRDYVGYDFDPLKMVFEIEDESSIFWDKVLKNEYLLGTLLGFGESNAWLHHHYLEKEAKGEKIQAFLETVYQRYPTSNADAKTKEDILFPLPNFCCYSNMEEGLLEKYKSDRDRIRQIYKGKDLVEVTLDRLTSKDLPEDPNGEYKKLHQKLFPKHLN